LGDAIKVYDAGNKFWGFFAYTDGYYTATPQNIPLGGEEIKAVGKEAKVRLEFSPPPAVAQFLRFLFAVNVLLGSGLKSISDDGKVYINYPAG